MFILSALILTIHFVILTMQRTTRACDQPLFNLLLASIVFFLFSFSFGMIFWIVEPVPTFAKVLFHCFGLASFLLGAITMSFSFSAESCKSSSTELYYWSLTSGVLCLLCFIYFAFTVPFWILNGVRRGSVLDTKLRKGLCYEPVSNCSCLWHV